MRPTRWPPARFPDSVPLPVDFQPEGIASRAGSTFYSASLTTGDIYQGDLRTGKGFVLVAPPGGGQGVGLKADVPDDFLFVAGGKMHWHCTYVTIPAPGLSSLSTSSAPTGNR